VIRPDKDPPHNLSRDVIDKGIASAGYQLYRTKAKKVAAAG